MISTIICEVGIIMCDIGTINVRFYLLEVCTHMGICFLREGEEYNLGVK